MPLDDNVRKSGNPTQASGGNLSNPYWQASMANSAKQQKALAASGYASNQFYNPANFHLPYPGAPHDGSPQDLANTKYTTQNLENANKVDYINSNQPSFMDKLGTMIGLAPIAAIGGGVLAPALSGAIGGVGGAIVGGAGAGAFTGGVDAAMTGGNIGKSLLTGALTGAVGGGLGATGIAKNATGALSGAGLNPSLASGLVKGAIGAGTGALGGALRGGNIGNSAITGGIGGFANGVVGNATGSSGMGQLAGTIGGTLAGKYLTSPSAPAAHGPAAQPTAPVVQPAAPPTMAPTAESHMSTTQQAPSTSPTNQPPGGYSGYGYAPRQQVQAPVQNYNTYGQGPEASFFQNQPGT